MLCLVLFVGALGDEKEEEEEEEEALVSKSGLQHIESVNAFEEKVLCCLMQIIFI